MAEIEIRSTVSTDLARLSALDHTIDTDYVWQLDLHREAGQVEVSLREVRLPRTVRLEHPRPANELPDTWHLRPMLSAMLGMEAVAYVRFTDEIVPHAIWITDVVVAKPMRGKGLARKLLSKYNQKMRPLSGWCKSSVLSSAGIMINIIPREMSLCSLPVRYKESCRF
jgi:GNAT superfamily N-acetyltransferase